MFGHLHIFNILWGKTIVWPARLFHSMYCISYMLYLQQFLLLFRSSLQIICLGRITEGLGQR